MKIDKNKKLLSLKGKFSCITGASGYIGSLAADTLASLGSNLIIIDIDNPKLLKLEKKLKEKYKVKIKAITKDLTEDDNKIIFKTIKTYCKKLDILINSLGFVGTSASSGWMTDFEKQTKEQWTKSLDVNLTSVFFLIQSISPLLAKAKNPSIINISSIYGSHAPDYDIYKNTGLNNPAGYSISKAGLNHMTKWLASTLAPKIRVNTISPGGILRGQNSQFLKKYINRTLLKRMGKEEDIRGPIIFLSTDMSLYITGQNIIVDGGWTIK